MNIKEPWSLQKDNYHSHSAYITADDGASYSMSADRARRLAILWNAALGIPTDKLPRKIRPRRIPQPTAKLAHPREER